MRPMQRTIPASSSRRGHAGLDFDGGLPLPQPDRASAVPLIVPGWHDSGPAHWQSLWHARLPGALRVQQDDWTHPTREAWVAAVSRSVRSAPGPVVIVAHSLGCIAAVHLPSEIAERVEGALLVAPADPERRAALRDFAPVPCERLPYRSIVVASTDDPYCPSRLAGAYARAWGSEFLRLPHAGHINVASGHGEWPLGWALLQSLLASTRTSPFHIAVQK